MGELAASRLLFGVQVPNIHMHTHSHRVNAGKIIFKSGNKTAVFYRLISPIAIEHSVCP